MPRRNGASTEATPERWTQEPDGEWAATGKATIKGRLTYNTRKRRKRIGKIKASHKAKRSN